MAVWLGCSPAAWRPHPGGGGACPRMGMALSRAWRHLPLEYQVLYHTCRCASSGCKLSMRVRAANNNSESSQAS
eukprot:8659228-Pyramimonas_sp.AAC.1